MVKKGFVLGTLLSVMILLSACGAPKAAEPSAPAEPPEDASQSYTFTDSLGRSVTVENPQRVAVVQGSFVDVWQLAGGDAFAVTEDAYFERELGLPEDVVQLGSLKAPSIETAVEAGVDFMILSGKITEHVALLETLEAVGINCAYFDVETFDDYLHMLEICTAITGRPDLYETNGLAVRSEIDAQIARSAGQPSPSVLFIRAFSSGAKAKGSDNMTGIMLHDLGCTNIADSNDSLLEDVSIEKIIADDPDYIFVVTMGESSEKALAVIQETLIDNPAWAGLSAVKNERYFVLPKDLFHYKPNARWGESYELLADLLYPKN